MCQVVALQSMVNALFGLQGQYDLYVPFFIDTLCIRRAKSPSEGDGRVNHSRKIGISRMNEVHAKASKVLVNRLQLAEILYQTIGCTGDIAAIVNVSLGTSALNLARRRF